MAHQLNNNIIIVIILQIYDSILYVCIMRRMSSIRGHLIEKLIIKEINLVVTQDTCWMVDFCVDSHYLNIHYQRHYYI